jgi:hypothetical protein
LSDSSLENKLTNDRSETPRNSDIAFTKDPLSQALGVTLTLEKLLTVR